jgi:hypothetical protein
MALARPPLATSNVGRSGNTSNNEPGRDDTERQRHLEILEALNRLTRSVTAGLQEIRDELRRQR